MNRLDELMAIGAQDHAELCRRQVGWAIEYGADADDIRFWKERAALWATKASELRGIPMDYDTNLTSTIAELEAAETPFADGQLAYRRGGYRNEGPDSDRFNQRTDWLAGWDLENDAANAAYLRKIGAE